MSGTISAKGKFWTRERIIFWSLSTPFLLIWLNWVTPVSIRTNNAHLDWWLALASFAGPIVLFLLIFIFRRTWVLVVIQILLGIISFWPVLIIIWMIFFDGPPKYHHTDMNLGFEPIHEVRLRGQLLRTYRTNGGATTDYGIFIRRETLPVRSFYLSETMFERYHQMDALITFSQDSTTIYVFDTIHMEDTLAVVKL